jgi:hypothetical protein
MPRSKEDIFLEIVHKVSRAVEELEMTGCTADVGQELQEASAIMHSALTLDEMMELRQLVPMIDFAASTKKIRCPDIPRIKEELEKFYERRWGR